LNAKRKIQSALALPVPITIFTFVAIAIFGNVLSFPGHLALEPVAAILAAATIIVNTFSAEITGFKVSNIN
jgi:hypothetical protein